MSITVVCGTCNSKLKVPDKFVGKSGQCPKCGSPLAFVHAEPAPTSKVSPATVPLPISTLPPFVTPTRPVAAEPKRTRPILFWGLTGGAALTAVVLWICILRSFNTVPPPPDDTVPPPPSPQPIGQAAEQDRGNLGSEDEARNVLTAVLDSWQFKDNYDDFMGKHPEVAELGEDDWRWAKMVLLSYEITGSRKDSSFGGHWDFSVNCKFENQAGPAIEGNRVYTLRHPWRIETGKLGVETYKFDTSRWQIHVKK